MGCGCGGGNARKRSTGTRAATSKTTYQVVLNGGNGRVAFTTTNEPLANSVAGNYPGSIVRPRGGTTGTTGAANTTTAPAEA